MIPTIEGIVDGLISGQYTKADAEAWLKVHFENAVERGYEARDAEVMGALV